MKILYGGAFNPPTIAHKAIIEYLKDNFKGSVIVMPTQNSYKNEMMVDYHHRLEMLKLMFDGDDRVEVSDFEAKQSGKYKGTCDLLEKLDHPFFVIGADQLVQLPNWINADALVRENRFIVFPRNKINIMEVLKDDFFKNVLDNFIIVSGFKELDASSSDYRNNHDLEILTDDVKNYIKENNLYNK